MTKPTQTVQKIARVYLRVSTEAQDLERQEAIVLQAKASGYYVAGVYREKASGARADRPELLRMIADLQAGEVVIAERIDRISRLPLADAEKLVHTIQAKGACLACLTYPSWRQRPRGRQKSFWRPCKTYCCAWRCRSRGKSTRHGENVRPRASSWLRALAGTKDARPTRHKFSSTVAIAGMWLGDKKARLQGCLVTMPIVVVVPFFAIRLLESNAFFHLLWHRRAFFSASLASRRITSLHSAQKDVPTP